MLKYLSLPQNKFQLMMKNQVYFLILLSILLTSCYKGGTYKEKLLQAEMIVNDEPRSALDILEKEIDPNGLSGSQLADWCLLITKARDKAYVKHESDSLINIAVDYYKSKHDSEKLMEAYFYIARISQDLGNNLKAQESYLKALDVGKNSDNNAVLARIKNNIGRLYFINRVYDVALPYFKSSVENFIKENDTVGISHCYMHIGRIYSLDTTKIDSSFLFYEEGLKYHNKIYTPQIMLEMSNVNIIRNDFDDGYNYIQKVLEYFPESKMKYSLGSYYYYTNKYDSAEYYLKDLLDDSNSPGRRRLANWFFYKMSKNKDQLNDALSFLETYTGLSDSIERDDAVKSLRWMKELHNYQRTENEISEIKLENTINEKKKYQLYLLSLFLLIVLIGLLFYWIRRKQEWNKKERILNEHYEKLRQMNESLIADNQDKIEQLRLHFEDKEAKEKEIVESRIKLLMLENEKLIYADYQKKLLIEQFKETDIYKKIYSFDFKFTEHDKDCLKKAIDNTYPNFFFNISKFYPKIKDDELFMCLLFKTGIKLKNIAEYMNLTPQAIAMKRERLFVKIFNKKGNSKDFDDFIESL